MLFKLGAYSQKPNLLIAGCMKCGSSTLHSWLQQHPDIFLTKKKELHYFDSPSKIKSGVDDYLAYFRDGRDYKYCGESTPSYIAMSGAIKAMHAFNPRFKILIIIRDPVRRAISHIYHTLKMRYKTQPDAISDDLLWQEIEEDREINHCIDKTEFLINPRSYHYRGRYEEQLSYLYRYFKKKHVRVLRLEDLISKPDETLSGITGFLKLAEFIPENMNKKNEQNYGSPPQDIIDYFAAYYAPFNTALNKKHGIQINDWIV